MRNHLPKVKTLKYTKTREGDHTVSGGGASEMHETNDGRITLIKSDNPKWRYEVYRFIDGGFLGYMGEIKRKISNLEDVE